MTYCSAAAPKTFFEAWAYASPMTLIAVAGGTGTAGRAVVAEAVARGYSVRSISRHLPAPNDPRRVPGASYVLGDFHSGDGVPEALAGVDALIETLDAKAGAALQALPVTTVAVLAAAARAGVGRCVLLSIVNAAQASIGYYQVQAARARSYESSGQPSSVVYATQFHNLLAGIFAAGSKAGLIPAVPGASFQPIATADVARVLVDEAAVSSADLHRTTLAGGPTIYSMKDLAWQWKSVTGRRGLVTPVPLPGPAGRFLRTGMNLAPNHAVGTVEFSDWLATRA